MLIKKLQLLTDDLKGTVKFYHELMGLPVLEESDQELSLETGATVLSFHLSPQQKPQYHFAFTIPCNKIEEAQAWIRRKVSLLPVEPGKILADFTNWNARAFYFLDNNENILEFIARNDLENPSATPFDASSIVSVSEIGIVSDDVPRQCADLIAEYGIDYFAKQPALSRFAALGDDNGLLIVVPYNRAWYPTAIPSTKHWLRVDMEINGREEVLALYTHI